jgi:hypothetical protein
LEAAKLEIAEVDAEPPRIEDGSSIEIAEFQILN